MRRSTRQHGSKKPQTSSRRANALGYAKRQALKPKIPSSSRALADVYEYQPEKVRRSKVKLELEREELEGIGAGGVSGSEGEGGYEESRKGGPSRPRLVGASDDEAGKIGQDEDEEIDSDGAFDESDEERFAGFSFGPSVRAVKIISVISKTF